ncbi:nucleotide-diphospho-sugar transferase [Dipodascopsis uninucleata]
MSIAVLIISIWMSLIGLGVATVAYIMVRLLARFPRVSLPSEENYLTIKSDGTVSEPRPLPLATEEWLHQDHPTQNSEVFLSVVVPAYNETARLPSMLKETVSVLNSLHFKTRSGFSTSGCTSAWELLLVDDGSKDNTAEIALETGKLLGVDEDQFRVCKLEKNRGKGGAVTHGLRRTRGKYVMFADADGASQFSDVTALLASTIELDEKTGRNHGAIAIGSRAHLVKTDAVVKRSPIRNFLMYSLHTILYIFGIRNIRDTQCGFKIFTHTAAQKIFPYMHNEGWIFDVEILILAERRGIPVAEVPINWHEVPGSKMELARDSIKMAIDLVVIRFAYIFGIYDDGRMQKE